jgi:hypothetical protein
MQQTKQRAMIAALSLAAGVPALGQIWIEPRDTDAGDVSASAQSCAGIGALTGIQGVLRGEPFLGVPDYQDLFEIFISNPSTFSATTMPLGGGADFDTNLWLFGPLGQGLLGNRNFDVSTTFSRLTPIAADGSFVLSSPGIYIVGVSGGNSMPTSGGNFIFNFATSTELSGPDGPGGAGIHDGWSGSTETGTYFIQLTGVSYVPGPGGASVVLIGGLGAFRRRRR